MEGFSSSLCHQHGPARSGKVIIFKCILLYLYEQLKYCMVHVILSQLKLEFFERKKGRWLLPAETSNWEVWTLQLNLIDPQSEEGQCLCVSVC